MIAYLEKYDTTVEVPDDIGQKDVEDINANFHNYVEQNEPTQAIAPGKISSEQPTTSQPAAAPTPEPQPKWQPNFYESVLKNAALSLVDPMQASVNISQTPEARATIGKAIEGLSFGAAKPIVQPIFGQDIKDHPAYAGAGEIAGGLGSLLAAGEVAGALKAGVAAEAAGKFAVEHGIAAGMRYIPPVIMGGATFGTKTAITDIVKHFEEGGVNLEQFGENVLKDTAFGGVFGMIGGMPHYAARVSSAAGLFFTMAKMDGADNHESVLQAGIGALYEAVGSVGRTAEIRLQAVQNLKESIGEYAVKRDPSIPPEGAQRMASQFVDQTMRKAGFDTAEDLAKSGPENLLEGIEKVNQAVRTAKIPHPGDQSGPALPKLPSPVEPEAPVTPPAAPEPQTPMEKAIDQVKRFFGIKPPPTPQEAALREPMQGKSYDERMDLLKQQGHDIMAIPPEKFPDDLRDIRHFEEAKGLKAGIAKAVSEISGRMTDLGIQDNEQDAILSHYGMDKVGQFGQAVIPTETFRLPIEDQYKQVYSVLAGERGVNEAIPMPREEWDQWQEILKSGIKPPREISGQADTREEYARLPLHRKNAAGAGIDEIRKAAIERNLIGENENIWNKIETMRAPNSKPEKYDARTMMDAEKAVDLINGYFNPQSQEVKAFAEQHHKASDEAIAQMAHDRGLLDEPNPDLLQMEIDKAKQEKIISMPPESAMVRYQRLVKQATDQGLSQREAEVWAKNHPSFKVQKEVSEKPEQTEIGAGGNEGFGRGGKNETEFKFNSESGAVMIPPDLVATIEAIQRSSDEISNLVVPSNAAPLAAQITRENLGKMARSYDMAEASLEDAHDLFKKQSKEKNLTFIDNMERGQQQGNEKLEPIAVSLRKLMDDKRKEIQDLGTGKLESFIENYFPHIWDQGEKGVSEAVIKAAKRPLEGSKGFLKKRSIETTAEGIEAGLTPVSYNPVDLVLLKIREMDKYLMAHRTINEYKENGLAKFVKVGGDVPDGWKKIDDRISTVMFKGDQGLTIAGHIYAQPDAARIINNYLSPGLQKSEIYQTYRYAGNLINQFQLGFSAFHLGFTSLDASVSKFALALNELAAGHPIKALENVIATPFAPIGNIIRGNQLLKAWRGDGQNQSDNVLAEAMATAGGRARMDQFYATKAADQMRHHFEIGNVVRGILHIPLSIAEISSKPILEYIVPRQKLGVFADMMKMEMENNPNMTHSQVREIAQRAWDSVDNRMGQLVYDNLFWNRTFKDLLMGSVRSVGWNLGTIREMAGGATDYAEAVKDTATGKNPDFTYRMAYLTALPIITGILGAMIQYLRTGKGPQEAKDYWFPRTGGTDSHGDPSRISLPSYMKDLYHYTQAPVQTVTNKLNPILAMMGQMLENKDFFGTKIRNEDDPFVKQVASEATYMINQVTPFSIRNMQRNQEIGNKTLFDTVGPWVGITPAPYDVNQTKAEKLAHEIAASHQEIGGRTQEQMERSKLLNDLTRQYRIGDPAATANIKKAYAEGLISHRQAHDVAAHASMTPLQRITRNFSIDEIERVYAKASGEEKEQIERILRKKEASHGRQYVTQ